MLNFFCQGDGRGLGPFGEAQTVAEMHTNKEAGLQKTVCRCFHLKEVQRARDALLPDKAGRSDFGFANVLARSCHITHGSAKATHHTSCLSSSMTVLKRGI